MKCKQYQNLIMRYFDHELNEKEKYILKQHIDLCLACSTLFKELNGILNTLEKSPKVDVTPEIEQSVLAGIESIPPYSPIDKNLPSRIIYGTTGFAVLIIVLFAAFTFQASIIDLFFAAIEYGDSIAKYIWNIQMVYGITYEFYTEAVNTISRTIQYAFAAGIICSGIICLKNIINKTSKIQNQE